MNGPAHYREAERCLRFAEEASISDGTADFYTAEAQVHATLALASATAIAAQHRMPVPTADAWLDAAS